MSLDFCRITWYGPNTFVKKLSRGETAHVHVRLSDELMRRSPVQRAFRATTTALGLVALTVVAHDIGIWIAAQALSRIANTDAARQFAVLVFRDEVYARLILGMLGNVEVRGLAVSSPIHALLDPLARSFLAPSRYLSWFGDWTGVVFTADSSAVGVQVIQLTVNLGMAAAGAAILIWLRGRGRLQIGSMLMLGTLWLGYGAGAQLQVPWGKGSGGEIALSMVATKLAGISSSTYNSALEHSAFLSPVVNCCALAVTIGIGTVAGLLFTRRRQRRPWYPVTVSRTSRIRVAGFAGLLLVVLVYGTDTSAVAFESSRSTVSVVRGDSFSSAAAVMSTLPSVVTITRGADGSGWDYRVNGQHELIRGMGYNAITTDLAPAQRAALYDRDFSGIRDAGANTIVGWSETEMDDLLMQKAAQHQLGVILPFVLGPLTIHSGPYYNYQDPAVRQQLMEAITRRVTHFRGSPALRMWGLGNEVLHALVWSGSSQEQLQAFADFLIQAADQIHALDPNHPIVYRDAEDWYAQPILDALARNAKPRPWFVYGMNYFEPLIDHALDVGRVANMQQPMMISEFGPVGLRPEARPGGYQALWEEIERRQDRLLGGCVYVWTTDGPEPLDRSFGLTDASGQPVDGSLAALSLLYRDSSNTDDPRMLGSSPRPTSP